MRRRRQEEVTHDKHAGPAERGPEPEKEHPARRGLSEGLQQQSLGSQRRRIRPRVWGGRGRGASLVLGTKPRWGGPDGQAAEPSPGSSGDRKEQRGPAFIILFFW